MNGHGKKIYKWLGHKDTRLLISLEVVKCHKFKQLDGLRDWHKPKMLWWKAFIQDHESRKEHGFIGSWCILVGTKIGNHKGEM